MQSSSEAPTPCILLFDIIESIIDLLAEENDKNSIKATSLVCRSVLPRCRKYLFSSIHINSPLIMERFRDILLSPQTDIPKYIRRLEYRLHVDTLFDVHPALLERMSYLQSLDLYSGEAGRAFDWVQMDPSARSALLNLIHLPTLTHLRLSNIQHFLVSDLSPCTSLTHLHICNIDVKDESPFPSLDISMVPVIKEYTIWGCATTAMKLLTAKLVDGRMALDFENLKRLCVQFSKPADVEAARSLLKEVKVEELRVDVPIPYLRPNMAFHTLVTTLYLDWSCFDADSLDFSFVALCTELSSMATANKTLKTLRLQLEILNRVARMRPPDDQWEKLDAVLSSPGWSCLEHIFIDIIIWDDTAKMEDLGSLTGLPTTRLTRLSSLNLEFKFSVQLHKLCEQSWS